MKPFLTIWFVLGALVTSAQLGLSKAEIVADKGSNYESLTATDGTPFIMYSRKQESKTIGTYTSCTVYYFRNGVCAKWMIIEPVSEINEWVKILNRDYVNEGGFTWVDYEKDRRMVLTKDSEIITIEATRLKQ